MLAMHKETIVSLGDLRHVHVGCQHCKTRIVLDLQEPSTFAQKHGVVLPAECPGCRKAYDLTLVGGLDEFQKSYTALVRLAKWISFSVQEEDGLSSK